METAERMGAGMRKHTVILAMVLCALGLVTCVMWGERDAERYMRRRAEAQLMQVQADLIGAPVHRPKCVETTAMGAAYLAGLAVGYWKNKEEVINNWETDRIFVPEIGEEERTKRLRGWKKAVKCTYGWAADDTESLS